PYAAPQRNIHAGPDVGPIVLALRGEGGFQVPVRVRLDPAVLDMEDDRLGDVADGHVAGDQERVAAGQVDPGGAEGDRWEALHVEEVRAAQVLVPVRLVRVDARRVDGELAPGVL